jgi:hypothetical protein
MDDLSSFGYAIPRYSLFMIAFGVLKNHITLSHSSCRVLNGIPAARIYMEATGQSPHPPPIIALPFGFILHHAG